MKLVLAFAALALLSACEHSDLPGADGEANFYNNCSIVGFTEEQCKFFHYGHNYKPRAH